MPPAVPTAEAQPRGPRCVPAGSAQALTVRQMTMPRRQSMREVEFLKEQERVCFSSPARTHALTPGRSARRARRWRSCGSWASMLKRRARHPSRPAPLNRTQEFQKAKIEKKLREEAEERQKALEVAEQQRKEQFARVQSSVQHRRHETTSKKDKQRKEAEGKNEELVCRRGDVTRVTQRSARSASPTRS